MTYLIRPLLFAFAVLTLFPAMSSATLVTNGVVTNTPLLFQASLTWTNPSIVDSLDLGNAPWDMNVLASAGSLQLTFGQHAFAPHSGDDPFGGNMSVLFQSIAPGSGGGTKTARAVHPESHYDSLTVTVTPVTAGVSSIAITAEHIATPEPATMGLGALGASVLLFARRFRRR